jgi:uncharacterized spore protein YtfJ
MIYAPRSKDEVDTVMQIIKAGVGWISGEKFEADTNTESQGSDAAAGAQMPNLNEKCVDHSCGAVAS